MQVEGGEEENKANSIPIAQFKSNRISQIDKKHREEETKKMLANGMEPGSPGRFDVIRLNNTTVRSLKEVGNKTVSMTN